MKQSTNYIDNAQMYAALVPYIKAHREAEANGTELPKIPNYLGQCIYAIAEGLAKRPNFSGYTYIEDMKADGIEDCIKYLHKFNIDKYDKPFQYYTKIIWYAFLRRIKTEKKEEYIKYKCDSSMDLVHTPEMQAKIDDLEKMFEKK